MAIESTALAKIGFTTSSSNPVESEKFFGGRARLEHTLTFCPVSPCRCFSVTYHPCSLFFFDGLFKEAQLKGVSPGLQADG